MSDNVSGGYCCNSDFAKDFKKAILKQVKKMKQEPSEVEFNSWNLDRRLDYLSDKVISECKKIPSKLKVAIDRAKG